MPKIKAPSNTERTWDGKDGTRTTYRTRRFLAKTPQPPIRAAQASLGSAAPRVEAPSPERRPSFGSSPTLRVSKRGQPRRDVGSQEFDRKRRGFLPIWNCQAGTCRIFSTSRPFRPFLFDEPRIDVWKMMCWKHRRQSRLAIHAYRLQLCLF
ncbi:hypothetical protein N658DRAFT_8103 [Parathielavia hyrcaniae]|uniref:Uncharacterized protein n=1 Tax=Parathielavia hyrcaniae TaxID=113614 RepID=A0AAN6Q9N1_9PEZI|nr:hypothetical protein N658DRAFT_8103 [Parathielavia hyrcaniae]